MPGIGATFDPTTATSGTVNTNMSQAGTIVIANHSGWTLIFTFADGSRAYSWAQTARRIDVSQPNPILSWSQVNLMPLSTGYNAVDISTYYPGEDIPETYPISFATPSSPGTFRGTIGQFTPAALSTWYDITISAGHTLQHYDLGNFPFSNPGIEEGLTTPGTIYSLLFSATLTEVPQALNGTQIEGGTVVLGLLVRDSSGTLVNLDTFPNNAIYIANLAGLSGASSSPVTFTSPIPLQRKMPVISVGSGAPYNVGPVGGLLTNFSSSSGTIFIPMSVDVVWGLTSLPPIAFT